MYLYTKQNNQRLGSFYAKGMSSITVVRDWNLGFFGRNEHTEHLLFLKKIESIP